MLEYTARMLRTRSLSHLQLFQSARIAYWLRTCARASKALGSISQSCDFSSCRINERGSVPDALTLGIESSDMAHNTQEVISDIQAIQKRKRYSIKRRFTLLTEELAHKFVTAATYNEYIELIERKLSDVDAKKFRTHSVTQDNYGNSYAMKIHLRLRGSVHCFYFKLCTENKCFDRSQNCMCH